MELKKLNILVVDDEEQIVSVLKAYLEKEGCRVHTAYNGRETLEIFQNNKLDFIILDLMLPDISGEEVCKRIRKESDIPIIMLTAKVKEGDRINGLSIGADDYVIKPFSPKELIARIRAILRRTSKDGSHTDMLEFNNRHLEINITKAEVKKDGKLTNLTPTEYKLLSLLAKSRGQVFSREDLITRVLGYDYDGYDRTIDVHIKNLRHKIEDQNNIYIKTVYGIGYKFVGE